MKARAAPGSSTLPVVQAAEQTVHFRPVVLFIFKCTDHAELTTTDEDDASQAAPLLDQINGPVSAVLADSTYNGDLTCRTVRERHPEAAVVILPRSTAVPCDTAEIKPTHTKAVKS
jgi:hypothetical protein